MFLDGRLERQLAEGIEPVRYPALAGVPKALPAADLASMLATAAASTHLSTVGRLVRIHRAISVFEAPSAAISTILLRATTPAGAVDARVNASNAMWHDFAGD